jgi:hypothetical protein
MTRAFVFIVSLGLAPGIVCRDTAWLAFEKGEDRNDLSLVQMASRLDPFVSDHAYEEYRQADDLDALERAIRLEPAKPAYHMYYGLRAHRTRAPHA